MGFFRLSLLALLDNKYKTTGKEKKKEPQDVKIQTANMAWFTVKPCF